MVKRYQVKTTVAAVVFATLVAVLCLVSVGITVDTNDDYMIHVYSSQAYGASTEYMGYTGILLARALVLLQRAFPSRNWFTTLEFLFLSTAFASVAAVIAGKCSRVMDLIALFSVLLVIQPMALTRLHYTKTAMILTLCGLVLISSALRMEGFRSRAALTAGFFFSVLGAQLRLQAFEAGCVFAPVLFAATPGASSNLRDLYFRYRRPIISLLALLAIVFSLDAYKGIVYRVDGDAQAFWEYCNIRANLSDYGVPSFEEHYGEYTALGMTRNDVAMIEDWSFADLTYFTSDKLAAVIAMRETRSVSVIASDFIKGMADTALSDPFLLFSFALFLYMALAGNRTGRITAVGLLVCCLFCYLYQYAIGRSTRWVNQGVSGCFSIALLTLPPDSDGRRTGLQKVLAVTLIPVTLLAGGLELADRIKSRPEFHVETLSVYRSFTSLSDNLYIVDLSALPPAELYLPTFQAVPDNLYANIYFMGGWDSGSSVKNSVLERYQAPASPYRALVEMENAFLVDVEHYQEKAVFVREHIDTDARYSRVALIEGRPVFAFTPRLPEGTPGGFAMLSLESGIDENPFFLTLVATVDHLPQNETAYVVLTTDSGEKLCYRAVPSGNTVSAVFPAIDVLMTGVVDVQVYVGNRQSPMCAENALSVEF